MQRNRLEACSILRSGSSKQFRMLIDAAEGGETKWQL